MKINIAILGSTGSIGENILDIVFNSSDYFYNVVNDFRSRVKYYDSGRSTNLFQDYEMEDEYFEMQQHR